MLAGLVEAHLTLQPKPLYLPNDFEFEELVQPFLPQ